MSPNNRTFSLQEESWLQYLYLYEPRMRQKIDNVARKAFKDEQIHKNRVIRAGKDHLELMEKEEKKYFETWNDLTGMKYLFNVLNYIPYTECWNCEETCKCGLLGSVWMIKMAKILIGDRFYYIEPWEVEKFINN